MTTLIDASSTVSAAVDWVRDLLVGSTATTVAVLAIAGVGLLMFNGRLPARRAARVVLGCFILFSAAAIANGIIGSLAPPPPPPPQELRPQYTPATPRPSSTDPYGGASVSDKRTKDIIN